MPKKKDEIWENPLVPHALMRRMYEAMLELRALEPGASGRRAGSRGIRGEEACRASSLLSLGAGDLVSDVPGSLVAVKQARRARKGVLERLAPGAASLPAEADAAERLLLAVGAASALRVQAGGRMVLAYAERDALPVAGWKQVLRAAGRMEAPIVFVLLPASGRREGSISDGAQGWGVPGMPVDATDAVALYRVMQESVLRARSGDGPALVECVTWRMPGSERRPVDGLAVMRSVLERRGLLARTRAAGARKASAKTKD